MCYKDRLDLVKNRAQPQKYAHGSVQGNSTHILQGYFTHNRLTRAPEEYGKLGHMN